MARFITIKDMHNKDWRINVDHIVGFSDDATKHANIRFSAGNVQSMTFNLTSEELQNTIVDGHAWGPPTA